MPKKGENSKAAEARAKKEEGKRAADAKQKAAADDREWAAAGEGAKSKAQAKKEEQVCSSLWQRVAGCQPASASMRSTC